MLFPFLSSVFQCGCCFRRCCYCCMFLCSHCWSGCSLPLPTPHSTLRVTLLYNTKHGAIMLLLSMLTASASRDCVFNTSAGMCTTRRTARTPATCANTALPAALAADVTAPAACNTACHTDDTNAGGCTTRRTLRRTARWCTTMMQSPSPSCACPPASWALGSTRWWCRAWAEQRRRSCCTCG